MSDVARDLLIVGLALFTSTIGSIGGLGGAILLVPLLTFGDMTITQAAPLGLVSVIAGSVAAGRRQENDGIVNHAISLLGIAPQRFLFNFPAVIFGLVQYMLPFAVLMLAPALTAIAEEVETAAKSLGASWPKTMWYVVLPMARPGLIGAGLVVLTLSLTDFAMPAMLGGGSQDFIANAIYDQFFRTSDSGLGAALTLALVMAGTFLAGVILAVFGTGTLAVGKRT